MRITVWFFVCSLFMLSFELSANESSIFTNSAGPPLICKIVPTTTSNNTNKIKPTCQPPNASLVKEILKPQVTRRYVD